MDVMLKGQILVTLAQLRRRIKKIPKGNHLRNQLNELLRVFENKITVLSTSVSLEFDDWCKAQDMQFISLYPNGSIIKLEPTYSNHKYVWDSSIKNYKTDRYQLNIPESIPKKYLKVASELCESDFDNKICTISKSIGIIHYVFGPSDLDTYVDCTIPKYWLKPIAPLQFYQWWRNQAQKIESTKELKFKIWNAAIQQYTLWEKQNEKQI